MKKKKIMSAFMAIICCTSLTGCADAMPDMTQEQQALVSEYAAGLLLKYSKNYSDGLSEVSNVEEVAEPVTEPEPEFVQEEETDAAVEETEDVETLEFQTENLTSATLEEALGLEDMEITYNGCSIVDAYPDDENAFFAVNAPQGKKMLVVKFDIENLSDEQAVCDILSIDPKFYLTVNGNEKKAMSTLLLDDMATYKDEIATGKSASTVLIVEVDGDMTEEDIQSLSIRTSIQDENYHTDLL